ncbi:MAG: hypothetical protein ACTHKQ_11860 [Mesorhizobium sp.]
MRSEPWDWPPPKNWRQTNRRHYKTIDAVETFPQRRKTLEGWYWREMRSKRPLLYKANISALMLALYVILGLAVGCVTLFVRFLIWH